VKLSITVVNYQGDTFLLIVRPLFLLLAAKRPESSHNVLIDWSCVALIERYGVWTWVELDRLAPDEGLIVVAR